MLKIVSDAGVNIEYVYSLVSTFVVLNVADVDRGAPAAWRPAGAAGLAGGHRGCMT